MQSLVKYLISLLFALLIHLLPSQLAGEFSEQSTVPDDFSRPKVICHEDQRLTSGEVFGSDPLVNCEARLYNHKENYG